MFSCKKYFFLFLICILTATTAGAQGRAVRKAARLGFWNRSSVSEVLSKRVERTYQEAITAQENAKGVLQAGGAAFGITQPFQATPKELYPQVPFLKNESQLRDYFLSRNNRAALTFLRTSRERQTAIEQLLENFKAGRKSVLEGEEINWLVSHIPDETSLLLLGEAHYIDDIKLDVMQLLPALRNKYPHRPIVLFTEFLPEGTMFNEKTLPEFTSKYLPVWATAHNTDIPTIGLEPSFIDEGNACKTLGPISRDAWMCYEGIRIRNTRWTTFIKNFRNKMLQDYPEWNDILIIVYAGAGHTEYGMPYSLANMFPKEKVFSVSFYPTYLNNEEGKREEINTFFDEYTHGLFAKDKTLLYKDPKLVRLMGANVRIKVDPVHKIGGFLMGPEDLLNQISPEELQQLFESGELQNLLNKQ